MVWFSVAVVLLLLTNSKTLAQSIQSYGYIGRNDYDYVIVGGGVAGLVLAARLSENPATTVLLLEAGPDPTGNQNVSTPNFFGSTWSSELAWNFTSAPQSLLGGATASLVQGHCFGGGSAINVMSYCRGAASVFDEWANISENMDLRWESLLNEFRESTTLAVPEPVSYDIAANSSVYSNGPVIVSFEEQLTPFEPYFSDAFLNDPQSPSEVVDFNDGTGIGVQIGGPHTIRLSNGTRDHSLIAYGYQTAGRPNVQLMKRAWVTKINFEGKRAVSVSYVNQTDSSTSTVGGKEIIVSAGAISTPKLLMLSGVGPKEHLEEIGINVVQDSPEIGSTLFDHHFSIIMVEVPDSIFTPALLADAAITQPIEDEYSTNGTGPLSRPGDSSFAASRVPDDVLKSLNATFHLNLPKDRPHVLYQWGGAAFGPNPDNKNILTTFAALVQPEAAGSVRLNSSDYRNDPIVDSNYYGSPNDLAVETYAYKRLLSIMRSEALEPVVLSKVYPGRNVTSDSDIQAALLQGAQSFHHPAGSVALGKALDSSFRLKGLCGIRVIDSSAFPVIPTCHLQSSVYALAESAAKLLKRENGF